MTETRNNSKSYQACVLGAGSWGTALAAHLAYTDVKTVLWGRDQNLIQTCQNQNENTVFLPGFSLPTDLHYTHDLKTALDSEHIIIATPSHAFGEILDLIQNNITPNTLTHITWATKGLDHQSGLFLHNLVEQKYGKSFPSCLLTGPSFAKELVAHKPTAVTLAYSQSKDSEYYAKQIQNLFHHKNLRVYPSSDLIGAELGGAVKNILAIAVGIADGLGFGMNTQAGLMTRGLAEMMRLGKAVGAQSETLMGLSGLGDLILTCSDNQSRNRRFGVELAKYSLDNKHSINDIYTKIQQVVEGVPTTKMIFNLAQKYQIDMPITEQMVNVLFNNLPPQQAVENLLNRKIPD